MKFQTLNNRQHRTLIPKKAETDEPYLESLGCGGQGGNCSLEKRELHKARLQRSAQMSLQMSTAKCMWCVETTQS